MCVRIAELFKKFEEDQKVGSSSKVFIKITSANEKLTYFVYEIL